jgi:hypothetical protein
MRLLLLGCMWQWVWGNSTLTQPLDMVLMYSSAPLSELTNGKEGKVVLATPGAGQGHGQGLRGGGGSLGLF